MVCIGNSTGYEMLGKKKQRNLRNEERKKEGRKEKKTFINIF